jgi:hypothetical protein
MSNYRNKKLTQSAKHEACVSCHSDDGTIVWAHSNSQFHGKGLGLKAHDLFGAYLCHRCHSSYDGHTNWSNNLGELNLLSNAELKQAWFKLQWEKSMIIACRKGYL